MMGSKRNLILAVLLGLLVAVDLFTWPQEPERREAQALLVPWAPGAVQEIQIQSGQDSLVVKAGDSGEFQLPGRFDFPVRKVVVENLVNGIASLTDLDLLSEDPASHTRYGVGPGQGVRILFLGAQGKTLADLVQGELAPGGRASYVRESDSDRVYRAPNFGQKVSTAWLPWVESRWMPLDTTLTQKVSIIGGELPEPIEISLRTGSRVDWRTSSQEAISASKMHRFLSSLGRVTLQSVEAQAVPAWQEQPDVLEVQIELPGGILWTGYLGNAEDDSTGNGIPAMIKRGGQPYDVRLAPVATRALRRSIRGLLN